MDPTGKYALVQLKLLPLDGGTSRLPSGRMVAATGYRTQRGMSDLFSVVLVSPDTEDMFRHDGAVAKLYPLAAEMESRLPEVETTFIITDGFKPVAECQVLQRGEDQA